MTLLTDWEHIEGNSAGTWAAGSRHPKLVAHTTEGATVEGAVAAYRAKNAWPHVTVDPRRRRRVQHVPLNAPARALRNQPGGVETGRAPIVIQVEIVYTAATTPAMAGADLDWLGTDVFGPLCLAAGVPLTTSVEFVGEGAGWVLASESARQRLSPQAWLAYEGVLGHQHVPENTHWDPGAIDMTRILAAARGTNTGGGLTMADIDTITARLDAIDRKVDRLLADAKTKTGAVGAIRKALGRLERKA